MGNGCAWWSSAAGKVSAVVLSALAVSCSLDVSSAEDEAALTSSQAVGSVSPGGDDDLGVVEQGLPPSGAGPWLGSGDLDGTLDPSNGDQTLIIPAAGDVLSTPDGQD
jgi:hypothetical protein